jgi:quinol monooxygenase YgiN
MGWKGYRLYSVNGNSSNVLVMEEFGSVQEAQAFLQSPELHEAMGRAGVSGPPEILIVEDVKEGKA